MKEEYQKFGSEMNTIHVSAARNAHFNGNFFCKESDISKHKPDPSIVDGVILNSKTTHQR